VAGMEFGGRAVPRDRPTARRRALGLTQEDLAALLGVERSTVVRWERGVTRPLPWLQPRLARALQVPAGRLAGLLDGPAPADAGDRGRQRRRCRGSCPRR
jgi:transcriptional regulator with XRE-family HTH domain